MRLAALGHRSAALSANLGDIGHHHDFYHTCRPISEAYYVICISGRF